MPTAPTRGSGSPGPAGPQGPPGVDGDKNFVFIQMIASSVWLMTHNLGKYPSVTILDSADEVAIGEVEYLDVNNVRVTFSASFAGRATLN